MTYDHIVLLHLICAIFFLGAITTEVLVLAPLHKHMPIENFRRIEFLMFRQIRRTYPLFLLPLYGSGIWMYSVHLSDAGGLSGLLSTTFGILLTLKLGLALGLLTIFASAPFVFMPLAARGQSFGRKLKHFFIVTGNETDFLISRFDGVHYLAFGLGVSIVILAKAMYFL